MSEPGYAVCVSCKNQLYPNVDRFESKMGTMCYMCWKTAGGNTEQKVCVICKNKLHQNVICYTCWNKARVDTEQTKPTGLQTPIDELYTAIPPLALHEMARYFFHRHKHHFDDTFNEQHWTALALLSETLKHVKQYGCIIHGGNIITLIRASYYALMTLECEITGHAGDGTLPGDWPSVEYSYILIPPHALQRVACVMASGTRKYGPRNWDKISVDDHRNHAIRHGNMYILGDTTDEPDGATHLSHMACRLLFALECAMIEQADKEL